MAGVDVTLRMPLTREGSRTVTLAAVPRIGETVQLEDGPWIVRHVVHVPAVPGEPLELPYVVLAHPSSPTLAVDQHGRLGPDPAAGDRPRWPCGCLVNASNAHRVGCPDFPEGRARHGAQ